MKSCCRLLHASVTYCRNDGGFYGGTMPKKAKQLSAIEVRRLNSPGMHTVGEVTGLYLYVQQTGAKSWILRIVIGDKRREIGLGGYPDVSLADARHAAREHRRQVSVGIDPIEEKIKARRALKCEQQALMFKEVVEQFFETKRRPEFSSEKHARIWINSLRNHIYPYLGDRRIASVTSSDVLNALSKVWSQTPQTGKKIRQRLEQVFEWAKVRDHYEGANPARWEGNLQMQLPSPGKVAPTNPHPAVQVDDLLRWYACVTATDGVGALGLRFLALTVSRSQEIRFARWDEIDMQKRIWNIPAGHMKARKPHRVGLSDAAICVLKKLPRYHQNDLVFPAPRGGVVSDETISACMKRVHQRDLNEHAKGFFDQRTGKAAVPHGIRSSFRDWVAERTDFSRELAEIALSHEVGSDVERAYRRTDMLDKRRTMMDAWAGHLGAELAT